MTPNIPDTILEDEKYNIFSDKYNLFIVNFRNKSNYIEISATLQNNIKIEYEKKYYLDDLKKNKFLSICDSINEVYEQIISELGKTKNKIIIEEKNQIYIIIPIDHIKVKEIKFILNEKKRYEKDLNKGLFNEISNLKDDNRKLKEEIINLKDENRTIYEKLEFITNENQQLNDKNIVLEEQIKNILEELNFLQKEKDINNFESSSILYDDTKQNLIMEWIKEKTNKNIIKLELIFKMSENGYSAKDFHNYCDYRGATLIIIKTKNKIFGGFTPLSWTSNSKGDGLYDSSNKTFIFSLDLMKKFDIINKENYAIYCKDNSGPIFGHSDISLDFNLTFGKCSATKKSNYLSENNLELTGGRGEESFFETEEIEVYRVI